MTGFRRSSVVGQGGDLLALAALPLPLSFSVSGTFVAIKFSNGLRCLAFPGNLAGCSFQEVFVFVFASGLRNRMTSQQAGHERDGQSPAADAAAANSFETAATTYTRTHVGREQSTAVYSEKQTVTRVTSASIALCAVHTPTLFRSQRSP